MDATDLIIPIRMDPTKVMAVLKQVGSAGKQAANEVEASARKAEAAVKCVASGADAAAQSLLRLNQAQTGLSPLKGVAQSMISTLNETANYARKLAADFITMQKVMASITGISGQPNRHKIVTGEVATAEAGNLTPENWADFRTKFMTQASMYVGTSPSSRMSVEDADKLQAAAAEFAKGKGVSAGTMANMVGGMLAQEKGATTAAAVIAKLGNTYAPLEASTEDPEQPMAGLTELMAVGCTAETASSTLAAMPEITPGQSATYLQRTLMELGQQQRQGKASAKQGLCEGMVRHGAIQVGSQRTPKENERGLYSRGCDRRADRYRLGVGSRQDPSNQGHVRDRRRRGG